MVRPVGAVVPLPGPVRPSSGPGAGPAAVPAAVPPPGVVGCCGSVALSPKTWSSAAWTIVPRSEPSLQSVLPVGSASCSPAYAC